MKKPAIRSIAILILFCATSIVATSQAWSLLGFAKVHGHKDYDEILVTSSSGHYSAIKLFVENEGIDFDHVVVHFGNGSHDKMEIKNFIPAGGETRVMDLPGGERVIKKVSFHYKSNAQTSKKSKVLLYGRR